MKTTKVKILRVTLYFKKFIRRLFVISLMPFAFSLGGCVADQAAVSIGDDTYMMTSWVPFGARPRAEFNATANANNYCSTLGKKMKLVEMKSNECMLRGGCGEAQIFFLCIDENIIVGTKEEFDEMMQARKEVNYN